MTDVDQDGSEVPTAHYANGRVKHRGARLDGEMHGPWEFYQLDGSLMRAGSFDRAGRVVTEKNFGD